MRAGLGADLGIGHIVSYFSYAVASASSLLMIWSVTCAIKLPGNLIKLLTLAVKADSVTLLFHIVR